jgi:hypothetical protein
LIGAFLHVLRADTGSGNEQGNGGEAVADERFHACLLWL